ASARPMPLPAPVTIATFPLRRSPTVRLGSGLEEDRQVLREKDVLVEDDVSAAQLPFAVDLAESVVALTDEDVGLGLQTVAVNEEARADDDFGGVGNAWCRVDDADIGDQVAGPGAGLFSPVDAGLDLADPLRKRLLALIEPGDVLTLSRQFAVPVAVLD